MNGRNKSRFSSFEDTAKQNKKDLEKAKKGTNENTNCLNHSLCFGDRKFNNKITELMNEKFPNCEECLCQ